MFDKIKFKKIAWFYFKTRLSPSPHVFFRDGFLGDSCIIVHGLRLRPPNTCQFCCLLSVRGQKVCKQILSTIVCQQKKNHHINLFLLFFFGILPLFSLFVSEFNIFMETIPVDSLVTLQACISSFSPPFFVSSFCPSLKFSILFVRVFPHIFHH